MKKKKNKSRSKGTYTTGILFGAAVLLLLGSVAGSSQAALTYYSENYSAELQMFDIGVTLVENGNDVSWRNYTQKDDEWYEGGSALLTHLVDTQGGKEEKTAEIQPGRQYEEELCVRNTGNIDQYVRVMIYRYWVDAPGENETPVPVEERRQLIRDNPAYGNIICRCEMVTEGEIIDAITCGCWESKLRTIPVASFIPVAWFPF